MRTHDRSASRWNRLADSAIFSWYRQSPRALARFGLLALVVGFAFGGILDWFPIATDLSFWYSGIGLAGACLLLGLTVYGFYTSLGGQSPFGRVSLEGLSRSAQERGITCFLI